MTIEEQLEAEKATSATLMLKLKTANAESATRRETITTMQGKIDAFDGIDIDKYNTALDVADKASKDKLSNQGKVDELRKEIENEFKPIIEKANNNVGQWKEKYRTLAVDKDLLTAAANHNAISPVDVVALARANVKMDDDGIVTVLDKKGGRLLNDSGEAVSIDSYVGSFLKDRPHYVKADGGGSGSQGGDGGGARPEGSQELIASGLKKLMG